MRIVYSSVLTLLVLAAGCNRAAPPPTDRSPSRPTAVKLTNPVQKALFRSIEQPGSIVADEATPLFAKLAGFAQRYYLDMGAHIEGPRFENVSENGREVRKEIKPGTLLADIAIPELDAEARQKQAMKQQAEKELKQSRQAFEIAKENVKAMLALVLEAHAGIKRGEANRKRWESESRRVAKLVESRTIDLQIGDETANQLVAAEAAVDEARARVATAEALARKSEVERDKAEVDIEVADAKLRVAVAEVERLAALQKYTEIRAPFDGFVTRRHVDTGQFVQPAGNPKAEPLFTVMKTNTVRVVVDVPEADASLVKPGNEVRVSIPGRETAPIIARLTRMSGALDPASRTRRAEIDVSNPDGQLSPGTYVNCRIRAPLPESYVLPTGAVTKVGQSMVCYLVRDNKALLTVVTVGRSDGEFVQVLKRQKPGAPDRWEDWTGQEIVAAGNAAYLTDGQSVEEAP